MLIQDFRKLLLTFILETSSGLRLLEHLGKYEYSSFPHRECWPILRGNRGG